MDGGVSGTHSNLHCVHFRLCDFIFQFRNLFGCRQLLNRMLQLQSLLRYLVLRGFCLFPCADGLSVSCLRMRMLGSIKEREADYYTERRIVALEGAAREKRHPVIEFRKHRVLRSEVYRGPEGQVLSPSFEAFRSCILLS